MQVANFIPKTIQAAPSVYRGCSLKELMLISGLSFLFNLLVWVSLATCLGYPLVGFGLSLMLTLGCVWLGTSLMQILKRGKPPRYHLTWLRFTLSQWGFTHRPYITATGLWQLGRTHGCKKPTTR